MELNQEGNVFSGIGCFKEECLGTEKKDLVNCDGCSKSDEGCHDIVDLLPNDPFGMEFNMGLPSDPFGMDFNIRLPSGLPSDPFGMDFNISLPSDPFDMGFNIEATFAAITGWIEDNSLKTCGFESDEASQHKNVDDNKLYAELNFVWTSSMMIEQEKEDNETVDTGSVIYSEDSSYDDHLSSGNEEEWMCFGCEKYQDEALKDYNDADGGEPANAFLYALGYLGVRDLLSVERVCKSLRDVVRNDPLLWRNLNIEYPLNDKITDDRLLQLTNRAKGTLCSLSLVKCLSITNNGLKHVLERNLKLTKLSVPGCIRLSVEAILHQVKVFNSIGRPGIKHLRIGQLLGATNQLLKEFKLLLGADEDQKSNNHKPRFYHPGQIYLSLEDERAIDIDTCPRCQQARQVYDCPVESCQVKPPAVQTCRACIFCIARCFNCGCCLEDTDYEEMFGLDFLCLDCLKHLLNGQDRVSFSPFTLCMTICC